ncbi:hypothetical protein CRENBAI_009793 [Crenichthys baileyi]|uniref:Uncharacterized protein n=1 Tax=Crenichthys baileyi TaxID=28760 RepID=A0AAV9QVV4_9TELE
MSENEGEEKNRTGLNSLLPDPQGPMLKSGEGFFRSGFGSSPSIYPTGCTWPIPCQIPAFHDARRPPKTPVVATPNIQSRAFNLKVHLLCNFSQISSRLRRTKHSYSSNFSPPQS